MAFIPSSGSVVAFQGTVPWSVLGTITGSVAAVQSGTAITSISGVVNTAGSVVAFQGANPWIVTGSVQATLTPAANQSVSGTVQVDVRGSVATVIIGGSIAASFTPPANQSVSGTVGASLIGLSPVSVSNFPTNQNVSGSVVTFQGTNPWIITGSVQASITPSANQSVSGTVTVGSLLAMPGIVSTVNSTTATLGSNAVFTGTSEEVKDFGSIVISIFTDQASATDGLSIQQSSNGTNWDITDTYTIPASTGKTIQVQPAGRFFRIVYTNGATIQGAFRMQTIFHPQYVKPTSQRAQDGYSNETDLEQQQAFGMVYNGATWDRLRGTLAAGVLVNSGSSSVLALQTGTVITSVSGTVNVSGSVAAFQAGTRITSIAGTVPVVGSVNALMQGSWSTSIQGTVSVLGTVPVTQSGTWISSISGNVTVVGSVNAIQQGAWTTSIAGTVVVSSASIAGTVIIGSIVGTYGEDVPSTAADKGLFTLGIRNDTVASLVGTDLDYTGWSTDSAGRHLTKPFAAEEARLSYTGSVVSGSVTAIFNSVIGLRNYITDFFISNTGATNTLVTFKDGSTSILGYAPAPAGGGAMAPGLNMPMRTAPSQDLTFSVSPSSSVVYMTVQGYKGP